MSAEKGASHVSRGGEYPPSEASCEAGAIRGETRRGEPWPRVKLGEVCEKIGSGATPSGGGASYCEAGISLIRSQNVLDCQFSWNGLAHINELQSQKLHGVTVKEGDALLNITGDSVARVCIVDSRCLPARVNQHVAIIRTDSAMADQRFVLYYLLYIKPYLLAASSGGSTRNALTKTFLAGLEIPLPPLPLQHRIADILSAYDDKIANNRRRMELLEESARLQYQKLVADLKSNGAIADVCREERNSVNPTDIDSDTPYIGLEHMPRRSISLCDWDTAQKVTSSKLSFNVGDILFGKIRPYFHKVGMTFVDGVASSDAIVIKPLRELLRPFVLLTVSSDAFVAAASQGMKEGSKMPRADWKQLLKYAIPIPNDDVLRKFNSQIQPIFDQLKALCMQNRSLASARDILLPQLMSGKKGVV